MGLGLNQVPFGPLPSRLRLRPFIHVLHICCCLPLCVCVSLYGDVFSSPGLKSSLESQWGKKSRCREQVA